MGYCQMKVLFNNHKKEQNELTKTLSINFEINT